MNSRGSVSSDGSKVVKSGTTLKRVEIIGQGRKRRSIWT